MQGGISTLTSREYSNGTEAKWKKAKIYNLAESSFISSCRESRSAILSAVATRGAFAFFAAPRRRDLSTGFPMLPFSRSNLPTCSSYIYLPYLWYVCPSSDVETTASIRPVEHNSVGTLFLFFFFPLIYFMVSNTRAVDQRIRCCSLAEPFYAFRVT